MTKKLILKRDKIEFDAAEQSAGRLATKIADHLRGKNKPNFSPHLDTGAHVTVINAGQIKFTGRKLVQKDYKHHSMHPGGLKVVGMAKVFSQDPASVLRRAVYGMLPKNKLRPEMMKRLIIKK